MKKLLLIIFLGIVLPVAVAADCDVGQILPPCACSGDCQFGDFLALGTNLVQYGIGILSIITLAFIIYGGVTFLSAMGNQEKIESGKKILGGTIRGLAIVLLAWTLVNSIIFLFTGNSSGFVFTGTDQKQWWKFEPTELKSCPVRVENVLGEDKQINHTQSCKDTTSVTPESYQKNFCRSLGHCIGNNYVVCCDDPFI